MRMVRGFSAGVQPASRTVDCRFDRGVVVSIHRQGSALANTTGSTAIPSRHRPPRGPRRQTPESTERCPVRQAAYDTMTIGVPSFKRDRMIYTQR